MEAKKEISKEREEERKNFGEKEEPKKEISQQVADWVKKLSTDTTTEEKKKKAQDDLTKVLEFLPQTNDLKNKDVLLLRARVLGLQLQLRRDDQLEENYKIIVSLVNSLFPTDTFKPCSFLPFVTAFYYCGGIYFGYKEIVPKDQSRIFFEHCLKFCEFYTQNTFKHLTYELNCEAVGLIRLINDEGRHYDALLQFEKVISPEQRDMNYEDESGKPINWNLHENTCFKSLIGVFGKLAQEDSIFKQHKENVREFMTIGENLNEAKRKEFIEIKKQFQESPNQANASPNVPLVEPSTKSEQNERKAFVELPPLLKIRSVQIPQSDKIVHIIDPDSTPEELKQKACALNVVLLNQALRSKAKIGSSIGLYECTLFFFLFVKTIH